MNLYINTQTGEFITNPTFYSKVTKVDFKRGDTANINIGFVADNELTLIGGIPRVIFAIKPNGEYDAEPLVYENAFTEDVNSVLYVGSPNFNTDELNDALNSGDGDETNDVAYLDTMLEITWSTDGVNWQSTNTIKARVSNDVIKDQEMASSPAVKAYVKDNFEKLTMTGLRPNQEVIVTGEGNRIERYQGDITPPTHITIKVGGVLDVLSRIHGTDWLHYTSAQYSIYFFGGWVFEDSVAVETLGTTDQSEFPWEVDWSVISPTNGAITDVTPLYPFVVKDAGTNPVNRAYYPMDTLSNGKVQYESDNHDYSIFWQAGFWNIQDGAIPDYTSDDDVEYPWLVTTWGTDFGSFPSPTLTEHSPVANESNWVDIHSTFKLYISRGSGTSSQFTVDGVVCPMNATTRVGWRGTNALILDVEDGNPIWNNSIKVDDIDGQQVASGTSLLGAADPYQRYIKAHIPLSLAKAREVTVKADL